MKSWMLALIADWRGRCGMRKAESRRQNAEGRRRKAECGRPLRRTGPAGGTHGKPGQAPAVQEIGSRLASSLPCTAICLMVIGRQGACSCESAGCRKRDPDRTDFHGPQLPTSKGLALHQLCKDKGLCSAECGVRKAEGGGRKAEGGRRKAECGIADGFQLVTCRSSLV